MSAKITIIGAGLIGRAWAITFARAGHEVALYDSVAEAGGAALDFVNQVADDLAAADLLRGSEPRDLVMRIKATTDLAAALSGATHVQENTPERIEIKVPLFRELDAMTAPEVPIASSTSGYLPSAFSADLPGRARCLVAHPINPPYLVPAVEIVPAPWTSPATVGRVRDLMAAVGQSPIVMNREIDGFVMNRLQSALLHEAFRLVAEGYAGMEEVDIGIRDGLGLRWAFMGPFETIDLNAPKGIVDYVERLGPMYARMFEGQRHAVDWSPPAAAMAEEASAKRPRAGLGARQIWRDRRLMALLAHKRAARNEIGD